MRRWGGCCWLGICALGLGLGILIAAVFPVGSVRLTDSAAPPDIGTTSWQSVENAIDAVYLKKRVT